MKPTTEIKGDKVLLLGYGREGQSSHHFLTKNYPHVQISIADQKLISPIFPVREVYNGSEYLKHLSGFTTVIRSPGIPAHSAELVSYQKTGGWVTTATNIFFSLVPGKTIGITGTKGKSTTSALTAHILGSRYKDVRLVGNIGYPMLDALQEASEKSIFVIELSGHQLEDVRFSPVIAVVLNIVPEHLDYYKDFSAYLQAKSNIARFQLPADYIIFNPDHPTSLKLAATGKGERLKFTLVAKNDSFTWIDKHKLYSNINHEAVHIINTDEIPLLGNLENVLAAVSVASLIGITAQAIGESVKTFKSLPHRLEYIGVFKGIKFFNDSLSTIPEATIHALDALGEDVQTLIAGGFNRGLDYTELGIYLSRRKGLKNLILFPDTGKIIREALVKTPGKDSDLKCFAVKTMEEAVNLTFKLTAPGKICLLSPASASFNLFRDYAERGEKFKTLVAAS